MSIFFDHDDSVWMSDFRFKVAQSAGGNIKKTLAIRLPNANFSYKNIGGQPVHASDLVSHRRCCQGHRGWAAVRVEDTWSHFLPFEEMAREWYGNSEVHIMKADFYHTKENRMDICIEFWDDSQEVVELEFSFEPSSALYEYDVQYSE